MMAFSRCRVNSLRLVLPWLGALTTRRIPGTEGFHRVPPLPAPRGPFPFPAVTAATPTALAALEVDASSEVVGRDWGRDGDGPGGGDGVGALFLGDEGAIAVPRGVAAGCLTRRGAPIAVVADDWGSVWDATRPERRADLVWVARSADGGRRAGDRQRDGTMVLFPSGGEDGRRPVLVYGRHAAAVRTTLRRRGVEEVSEVESWADMRGLVARAAADDADDGAPIGDRDGSATPRPRRMMMPLPDIGLECTGEPAAHGAPTEVRSAIVVGGGIVGSSIARALSRRGLGEVTLYDPTPAGIATPASWAWLNANQKPPPRYKSLNQMGLRAWRSDPLLSSLGSLRWCGTLVKTSDPLDVNEGGYTVEGPLDAERIRELEPAAEFSTDDGGRVYYFADEGHVDPREAVRALRREAADGGVSVVREEVAGLVRRGGRVAGVTTAAATEHLADVVILAAGANSDVLGGVPLTHHPSRTYFGEASSDDPPAVSSPAPFPALRRTLVDMTSSLYLAQRVDGTTVVGGGAVKFGLSRDAARPLPEEARRQLTAAQEVARRLAPGPLAASPLTRQREVASKPMPRDGFPILGYGEPGLYSAVTHSGMTLAPLIGPLVAAEVTECVSLDILEDYRPARFGTAAEKEIVRDWQESKSKEKTL